MLRRTFLKRALQALGVAAAAGAARIAPPPPPPKAEPEDPAPLIDMQGRGLQALQGPGKTESIQAMIERDFARAMAEKLDAEMMNPDAWRAAAARQRVRAIESLAVRVYE